MLVEQVLGDRVGHHHLPAQVEHDHRVRYRAQDRLGALFLLPDFVRALDHAGLQLDGLLANLFEQPGVPHRDRQLRPQRLEHVQVVFGDAVVPLALHDEHADHFVGDDQRDRQRAAVEFPRQPGDARADPAAPVLENWLGLLYGRVSHIAHHREAIRYILELHRLAAHVHRMDGDPARVHLQQAYDVVVERAE